MTSKSFKIVLIFLVLFPLVFSEEIFIISKESYKNQYTYGESISAEFAIQFLQEKIIPKEYIVRVTTGVKEPIIRVNDQSIEGKFAEIKVKGETKRIRILILGKTPGLRIRDSPKNTMTGTSILLSRIEITAVYDNGTLKQSYQKVVKIIPNEEVKDILNEITRLENEITSLEITYKKLELAGKKNEKLKGYIDILRRRYEEIIKSFNEENYEKTRLLIIEADKYIEEAKKLTGFRYEYLIPIVVLLITIIALIVKKKRERL